MASACGFTDSGYKELVQLQTKYDPSQFVVLAFPCNQFGKQEPKKNKYILKFATDNYQVNFDIFAKLNTLGKNAHPLYKWLKKETGEEPTWNFSKYLLNQKGEVERFMHAWNSPLLFEDDIKDLLAGKPLTGGILKYDSKTEL